MHEHKDNRYVAHFDMLGMGPLIKLAPNLAWEKLSALSHARQERMRLGIQRLQMNELIADQTCAFTFSDTIVSFSKGNSENDALALLFLTTELFTPALHYWIPLRGGFSDRRILSLSGAPIKEPSFAAEPTRSYLPMPPKLRPLSTAVVDCRQGALMDCRQRTLENILASVDRPVVTHLRQ